MMISSKLAVTICVSLGMITTKTASYHDIHLEIVSEGLLGRKLYDKRDNFPIVNFPFKCINIPAAPAYQVHSYQLIRYIRACGSYEDLYLSQMTTDMFHLS